MLLYHLTTGPVKELKLRHGLNSEEFIVLPVQCKSRNGSHIYYRMCIGCALNSKQSLWHFMQYQAVEEAPLLLPDARHLSRRHILTANVNAETSSYWPTGYSTRTSWENSTDRFEPRGGARSKASLRSPIGPSMAIDEPPSHTILRTHT